MSHAWRRAVPRTSLGSFLEQLRRPTARLVAEVQLYRRLAHDRRILSELSDEQLKDAGIERWAVFPSRPTLEVEAGLMGRLMSMR